MADTPVDETAADTPVVPTPALADPGDRGTLTVKDRVIERIATQAMSLTEGVSTTPGGLTRRNASKIHVQHRGDQLRARADVATVWPQSAAGIAAKAQRNVRWQLDEAGMTTEAIDVFVTSVHTPDETAKEGRIDPVDGAAEELLAARTPRDRPAVAPLVVLLCLLLIAAGVVAVRDALVYADLIAGPAWTGWVFDHIDGVGPQSWMTYAGIGVAVVGLLLLFAALKPRSAPFRLATTDDVWIRRDDVEALLRHTAADVPMVQSVKVKVKKRTVKFAVLASFGAPIDDVKASVQKAVDRALTTIDSAPTADVSITEATAEEVPT